VREYVLAKFLAAEGVDAGEPMLDGDHGFFVGMYLFDTSLHLLIYYFLLVVQEGFLIEFQAEAQKIESYSFIEMLMILRDNGDDIAVEDEQLLK
jgi:glycine cleavage system protein P-like pyridoxal-binding family